MPKQSYEFITHGVRLAGEAMPKIVREFQAAVVGRKITDAGYIVIDGEAWPCLTLDDGESILIQCDDVGNHPGVPVTALGGRMLCRTHPKK